MERLAVEWFFREYFETIEYVTFNGTLIDYDNLLTASK